MRVDVTSGDRWVEMLQLYHLRNSGRLKERSNAVENAKRAVRVVKQVVGVAKPVVTDDRRGYGFGE